jgi:hypothetical protein
MQNVFLNSLIEGDFSEVYHVFPYIHISLRPEGWDRDVFIEWELPEELEVKYLNKGRSHKATIDTGALLQTIASNGINVSIVADTLYIWQKTKQ